MTTRKINTLMIGYHALILDNTLDRIPYDRSNLQLDQSVIDQNRRANTDILAEMIICHTNVRIVTIDLLAADQCKLLTAL